MPRPVAILLIALCVLMQPADAGAQGGDADIAFWNSVRDSTDADEFRAYLESFPDGSFAPLARLRIKKLSRPAETGTDSAEPPQVGKASPDDPVVSVVENDIGYIGARISDLTAGQAREAGLGEPQGARIAEIVAGGPAERAGLIVNDIVMKVGSDSVANMLGFLTLTKRLKPGQQSRFEIVRGGRVRTLSITVGGFVADNLAAAKLGDSRAMLWLYGIYAGDRLGNPDVEQAMRWLNAAVDAGHPPAFHSLAELYWNGTNVGKDQQKAKNYYQQAADRGYAPASSAVARIFYNGLAGAKNLELALSYFRQAADAGDSAMMHQVGYMYLNGEGTARNAEEATRWYKKSADAGYAIAMSDLALRYHTGDGVAQDHARAAIWYDRALEAGNKNGLYNMSLLHANGQGVEKNETLAADYFFQALMQGDVFAQKQIKTNASGWSKKFRRHIQKLLTEQGVYDGKIDGSIGPKSRKSLDQLMERQKNARDKASAAAANRNTAPTQRETITDKDHGLDSLEDLSTLD